MKIFEFLLILSIVFSKFSLSAQYYEIAGKAIDLSNMKTIDSVLIYNFSKYGGQFQEVVSDADGFFVFDNLRKGSHDLSFMKKGYKTKFETFKIKDSSIFIEVYLIPNDSPQVYKIEDIASTDNYHGGFGVDFYNPPLKNYDNPFKNYFSIEYIYSFKKKICSYDQIGFEFSPLKLVWGNLNNDSVITPIVYGTERYFGYYVNTKIYNRIFFFKNKNSGAPGLIMDLGISYEFPLTYRYKYFDGNSAYMIKNIHNYKELELFARFGYDVFLIKAGYVPFNVLKEGYPQPPPFQVGFELNFPSRLIY